MKHTSCSPIKSKSARYRDCALMLAVCLLFSPNIAGAAAPVIPGFYGTFSLPAPLTGTLPVRLPGGTLTGATVGAPVGNTLTINQNTPQAVIDWSSFNIAAGSSVRFYQGVGTPGTASWTPNRDYAALNRIFDSSPSQIYGNLTADGKIYLINRNGILFGPGSQVNVHALAASALNITQDNFTKGLLRFTTAAEGDQATALGDEVTIANHGTISTDSGGSVSLIGPQVENAGSISAPQGSVNLVGVRNQAGGNSLVEDDLNLLTSFDAGSANVIYNAQANPGSAVNFKGGVISTDSGRVGMYGDTVRQGGVIRAVSAVKKAGEIYLKARSRMITGAGSLTETPVSSSPEKVNQTFVYNGGTIQVGGLTSAATFVPGAEGGYVTTEGTLQAIEHNGSIAAPSGTINLAATDRIFMDSGSSIDVAGKWVDLPASANLVSSTLNSVELRDFYVQKYGDLMGEKILSDLLNGSAIGDISGSYAVEEKTALERSTRGGVINLTSGSTGQIVVKEGAVLDISGGGVRYAQGTNPVSMLVAGNRVFDIASAPQSFDYTLLDSQSKNYARFGITETFQGLFYGGGSAVNFSSLGRIAGSDAGSLSLLAEVVKLDGTIHGDVTRGVFQTKTTPHASLDVTDPLNTKYFANVARGLERPVGGTLLIGADPGITPGGQSLFADSQVRAIVVKPSTATLAETFTASDQLGSSTSELSAALLSEAGLGTLSLFSNTTLAIEPGARIALASGGSFTAKARRIDQAGAVVVPGGSATFVLQDNITAIPDLGGVTNPRYTPLVSSLYFAPGSLVSTSGETIDNTRSGRNDSESVSNGLLGGGKIAISDLTVSGSVDGNNLTVAQGATLDVSGGYLIDQSGRVNGGDAGSLELRATNLSLGGELRGLALPGKKGGEITLHSGEIAVGLPGDALPGTLQLSPDRLDNTGFTRLNLIAANDVTFISGINLKPDTARLPSPVMGARISDGAEAFHSDDTAHSPDYLGPSSIRATAGTPIYRSTLLDGVTSIEPNLNARIVVDQGATLGTTGGGVIALNAPGVDIAGTLSSPGGTVSITARGSADVADLNLLASGRIMANGYNKPDGRTAVGTPTSFVPQSAGSVSLAANGSINLQAGSIVDLSGSDPAELQLRDTGGAPQQLLVAGNPGSLSLTYRGNLNLNGTVSAEAHSDGIIGGTLTVRKTPDANNRALELTAADVALYQASGFDALTFASASSISLPESASIAVGRSLTLDTPSISGSAGSQTTLQAPWLRLTNTSTVENLNPGQTSESGGGMLTLSGKSLDISGNMQIKGFEDVRLESARDITFSDRINANNNGWVGNLWTTGNLTLQAQRIFPTTASQYTVTANGKVTILPQGSAPVAPGAIYSAGGSLTIQASGGIEQRGLLAAPLGEIKLDGMGSRVYLAEGSSILTGGSVPVSYGYFDGNTWSVKGLDSKGFGGSEVQAAPDKSITLTGREVIVKEGAVVDSSGGGSIYAALWQAGLEGSVNPFTNSSSYVILPDNSVTLPGRAIYLDAAPELGLTAGVYSILPAEFAFQPGALLIQDTGVRLASGTQARTAQGYRVVGGYATVTDTAVSSPVHGAYVVRRAEDVATEGNFTNKQFVGADGGTISVSAGETAVMAGSLQGAPLSGGQGAVFSLSGTNVQVKDEVAALESGFAFNTPIPPSLAGSMQLRGDSVSNKGLKGLELGDGSTETVTIESGSVLQVPEITMTAKTGVLVESGAQVLGSGAGGAGTVTVNVPVGTFTLEENAVVRASHGLSLNAADIVLNGELAAENSTMSLTAQNIYFVPDTYQRSNAGLYLNESLWNKFSQYENLTLKSSNDMVFQRDVTLTASGSLNIDAGRLLNQAGLADVKIEAQKLSILNSGATQSATPGMVSTGEISLGAGTITVSSGFASGSNQGGVLFDGFGTVNMASSGDMLLQGAGSIATAGDLKITASRLAASYLPSATGAFLTAADFQVTSGGKFSYVSAGTSGVSSGLPGGNLAIKGSTVRIAGLIDMPSGNVTLAAMGPAATDGVYLDAGARIQTQGAVVATADARTTVATPGGRVELSAVAGPVEIAAGAGVDVSAAEGSDAGSLVLSTPGGQVTIAGQLRGTPASGRGGSFELNSRDLAGVGGLDGLSKTLSDGGFSENLTIHSRGGDLTLANGSTLTGREVVVAADGGSIDLSGKISADGVKPGDAGGRVELYAGTALTLQPTAVITARGVDAATGGAVVLSAAAADKIAGHYALQATAGSAIDVSGGVGGTVSFRAYELAGGSDVNMAPLPADAITGAARVSVEETKKYTVNGNIGAFGAPFNSFMSDANLAGVKSGLFANVSATDLPGYHLLAGIELVGDPGKDLILDAPWDLTSVRPGGEAGILTLRAAGNLDIAKNLVDKPTAYTALRSDTVQSSWGINLVAGADLQGANPLAVSKGQGNLVLGPMNSSGRLAVDGVLSDNALGGALVYSENAPINFASGNNTDIGYGVPGAMINTTMRYNIGSYGGVVRGETGGDLTIRAGAIQTAISAIDLRVAGDLNLLYRRDGSFGTTTSKNQSSTGSIRTTGEYTPGTTKAGPDFPTTRTTRISDYWTYAGGGDIKLAVNGTVAGQVNNVVNSQDAVPGNSNAWDTASGGTAGSSKYLTANYISTDTTEGIVTLAGGNIAVRSGKGFTSQVGAFGNGNLSLVSGGDMNGRYRSTDGFGSILAMGNFGAVPQVLELGAAQAQVVALGNLDIGAVLNPDNTRVGVSLQNSVWDLSYTYKGQESGSRDSAVSLISLAGATSLSGVSTFDGYNASGSFLQRQQILPPVTEIITAGDLQINGQFALAPSPSGDLRLIAGGNVNNSTNSSLAMVDVPLDTASPTYAYQRINTQNDADSAQASLFSRTGINLLHQGDSRIAEIRSGQDKDIVNLHLNIDKPVAITAGRDITELVFSGQNLDPDDVTTVRAGRDIDYSFSVNQPATALEAIGPGIKLGGPGALLVQAGRNIDLGNSTGIQSVGGFLNPPLGDTGASVTVIAGAKQNNLTTTEVAAFFYGVDGRTDHADPAQNGLIKAGDVYSKLKNSGEADAAREQLDTVRSSLIRPWFDEPAESGEGFITMTSSQINSLASGSDVTILARGSLDVGRSSLGGSSAQQGSGISTAGGGRINIYTGKDVNVNESRIMSYLGGDISVWVDQGDLNAGRGSRTSISPSPPRKVYDPATKTFITKFTPPSVGSGIRAVTFDPNTTPGGPLPVPEAGNINVYVPNGKIDAGEAGIVTANKLTLAATEVVNVKNIVGGAGSVGVPVSTDNSVSLGALGGNSSLTESNKMMETASTGGLSKESAQNKLAQAEDFLSKYLDVKVTSFDTDAPVVDKETLDELTGKKKKK